MGAQNANDNNTQLHDIDHVPERRPEEGDNNDRSPLDEGYQDGLGEHIRLDVKTEETGGLEVVEVTFARNIEQPPVIGESKDSDDVKNPSRYGQEQLG